MTISGYGGESYAGRVSKETYEFFKDKKIDIEEFATEWGNKFDDVPMELQPFSPGSPYDCDDLFHNSGAELTNLNYIRVDDEHGDEHWVCQAGLDELEDAGVEVERSGGFDLDDIEDHEVVFNGGQGEKGTFFEGEIDLKEPFDPKKLTIYYEDCNGWWIIGTVEYDGEEIDGSNGYSTTGKWSESKWIVGSKVEEYDPVSRDDVEDEQESDCETSEWPEIEDAPAPPLTDWYPADVNPAYKGEYDVDLGEGVQWPLSRIVRREWTGKTWKDSDNKTVKGVTAWRGLAVNPEEI